MSTHVFRDILREKQKISLNRVRLFIWGQGRVCLTKSCQFRDLVPLKYKHQSSSTFFATVPRPINPTWILEVLPKCTLNIIIVSIIGNLNGLKTFLLSKDSLVKPYCLSISMRYYYKLIIFVDALKCRLFLTIFLGVGGGGIS